MNSARIKFLFIITLIFISGCLISKNVSKHLSEPEETDNRRGSILNSPYDSKHLAFFNSNNMTYSCKVSNYISKTDNPLLKFRMSFDYKKCYCNAKFTLYTKDNKKVLTITDFQKYNEEDNVYIFDLNKFNQFKLEEHTVYKGFLTVCDGLHKASIKIAYKK